jgi:hypothetical protein
MQLSILEPNRDATRRSYSKGVKCKSGATFKAYCPNGQMVRRQYVTQR